MHDSQASHLVYEEKRKKKNGRGDLFCLSDLRPLLHPRSICMDVASFSNFSYLFFSVLFFHSIDTIMSCPSPSGLFILFHRRGKKRVKFGDSKNYLCTSFSDCSFFDSYVCEPRFDACVTFSCYSAYCSCWVQINYMNSRLRTMFSHSFMNFRRYLAERALWNRKMCSQSHSKT